MERFDKHWDVYKRQQFVHGDYIIFLDSDDIVPDGAYEAMYKKAVETGNDMVVGDVQRFNSRKIYNSGLHRKAFRDAYDKTSILETPQLIYDTCLLYTSRCV